jgi:predicted enzyme related to lactoylglutathione lyase
LVALLTGQISFLEIGARDAAATSAFFASVFGWPLHDNKWFQTPGLRAGLHGNDPSPQIYVFFHVPNLDAAIIQVREAGGEPGPTQEAPGFGRYSICTAPGGLTFGINETDRSM